MRIIKDFEKPADELAPYLIGKVCVVLIDNAPIRFRITETECYMGEDDSACHAARGMTPRTKIMYGPAGVIYVYLCYGMHCLMNVICGAEGSPEGVLIRSVRTMTEPQSTVSGPGRVTRALKIDKSFNGESLITSDRIWLGDDGCKPKIITAKRIGIPYASEKDQNRLWRFLITE